MIFGKSIAGFQVTRHKLADMATELAAARALLEGCIARFMRGDMVTGLAAMTKNRATDMLAFVSDAAVQIHGGYGYTKDYPAEKFWRDSKLCTIGEGTSEIQRVVIAKQLLKA